MVGLRASEPYTLDAVLWHLHVRHPLFTPDADVEIVALCRSSLLQGCSVHVSLSSQIIAQFGWCVTMLNLEIPPSDARLHVTYIRRHIIRCLLYWIRHLIPVVLLETALPFL
jgi:hypothetical protein